MKIRNAKIFFASFAESILRISTSAGTYLRSQARARGRKFRPTKFKFNKEKPRLRTETTRRRIVRFCAGQRERLRNYSVIGPDLKLVSSRAESSQCNMSLVLWIIRGKYASEKCTTFVLYVDMQKYFLLILLIHLALESEFFYNSFHINRNFKNLPFRSIFT